MSKFKMKLKLQGLELEIEGSREDIPLITQNIGQQLGGLITPAGAIIEGEIATPIHSSASSPANTVLNPSPKKSTRKRKVYSATAEDTNSDSTIDWRHDPAKYCSPKQDWNTATKAMWLLYVVAAETETKELSSLQISSTFNKHFKQAKTILTNNVSRDLGKQKMGKNPPVAEDTTKTPSKWYLTESGNSTVQNLIAHTLQPA